MKDSFFTSTYKGGYIHSYQDRILNKEILAVNMPDGQIKKAKTVIGAKRMITKHVG